MSENQNILAIETSTTNCSAALLMESQSGSRLLYEAWENAPRQHTDLILPMLDDVLQQGDCCLSDIDALAFGCGPGTFTGVRIASSVTQAISFAADIKVIPVSSLAAMAQGAYRTKNLTRGIQKKANQSDEYNNIIVASDARMNEVYLACYQYSNDTYANGQNQRENMTLIGEEQLLKPENIGSVIEKFCQQHPYWVAVGSGWLQYQALIEPLLCHFPYVTLPGDKLPHAQDVAILAAEKLANNEYTDAHGALPVYLRNDVAKKSVIKKMEKTW